MEAPARMRSVWRRRFTTLTGESMAMTLPAVPLSETTYAASSTWLPAMALTRAWPRLLSQLGKSRTYQVVMMSSPTLSVMAPFMSSQITSLSLSCDCGW